jgi:rSAM/selenodomain-associated transferase 1
VRRVLGLFAKRPAAGRVKTRLVPPLTPAQAAALYRHMLLDVAQLHAGWLDGDLAVWYSPADARAWFARHLPPRYRLEPQSGAGLAERLRRAVRAHSAQGYARIVLRGTDSPTLPPERVGAAFDALERVDLVLCPDLDGGYNLIGLRAPCDALFELQMSTPRVLEQTCAQARRAGLRSELLPAHGDVDTALDLLRLAADPRPELAPRTLRWIARHRPG